MEEADPLVAEFAGATLLRWRVSRGWAQRWGRPEVWAAVFRCLAIPAGRVGAGLLGVLAQFLPAHLQILALDCARVPLGENTLVLPLTLMALKLNLSDTMLTDATAAAVAGLIGRMVSLEQLDLDLRGNPFRAAGWGAFGNALRPTLRVLRLNLRGWGFDDSAAAAVAEPVGARLKDLRELALDFGGSRVSGVGAARVFANLPPRASTLDLRFFGCALGDDWLGSLAFPASATEITVEFSACGVGDSTVAALAGRLPRTLTELDLRLVGCGVGCIGCRALALALPASLTSLTLDLSGTEVQDAGLMTFKFFSSLKKLHFAVGGCEVSLLPPAPESVETLLLDVSSTALTPDAAGALVASLPRGLTSLDLNLSGVQVDGAVVAAALPSKLDQLRLDFTGCALGQEGAERVRERVAVVSATPADVRYDAFGTDMIINVDEEDLSAEGLLALRANAILADDDPVLLNNLHVYTDERPSKRARTGAQTKWMNRMTIADAILDE